MSVFQKGVGQLERAGFLLAIVCESAFSALVEDFLREK
jgi:hypothetical protein